ncbi:MAG: dihydroorotase [Acaryochloridaceae cyanobacterium RL_2_7]|nr:dihydroorotase [Acaryochloridaceae cyanobacterium RL_2_7]
MSLQLVRQAHLIDPVQGLDQVQDVLVRDGVIEAIAPQIELPDADVQVIEAQGCYLGPGLVDLYSTSGEPGYEDRETLAQLIDAAMAGGFTRVHLLPQTQPALDHPGAVQQLFSRMPRHTALSLKVWGALSAGIRGEQLSELKELLAEPVVGLSDGAPLQDMVMVQRLLDYVKPLGVPLALWPCLSSLARDGVIRDGIYALNFGLPSMSVAAETSALAALLELIEQAQSPPPIHLMRISTARSVQMIAEAKARNLPITASTPWTHLMYDSRALRQYDPMLRLDPPLGNPQDRDELRAGVAAGVIDAIAVDHRAYTYEEKTVPFSQAPPGCPGYAIAFPLLWQSLVAEGAWSASTLWKAISTLPAQCLDQEPPTLEVGQVAEMILFNPNYPPEDVPWSPESIQGSVQHRWGFATVASSFPGA